MIRAILTHMDLSDRCRPSMARAGDSPPHTALSDREFEVFRQLVGGRSITDIAERLHVSVKTVSTHKARILEKMAMTSTAELVRYAVEHRLLDDQA